MSFSIHYLVNDLDLINKIEGFLLEWRNPSLFIETFTSGSTGKPKRIKISKEQMIASAKMTGEFLKIKKNENALLNLSIDSIAGKMMVVRAVILELNLYVTSVSNNPFKDQINLPPIDFIALVPIQVQRVLNENYSSLLKIRNIIIGGGEVSNQIINNLQKLGVNAFQTFGMTETISHFAMRKISPIYNNNYSTLPGITISKDSSDRLIVNAPNLAIENLASNDIVELINPTTFNWKGRADFVINSGGIKLHPEVIEQKISDIIPIPYFISSEKDDILGNRLILLIETSKDNSSQIKKEDLKSVLSKYELPKKIYTLEKFIRTSTNKINRIETLKLI